MAIFLTPASASLSAMPRPRPRELPVTSAVFCGIVIGISASPCSVSSRLTRRSCPNTATGCKVQTLRAAIAAPPVDAPAEARAEVYTAARRLAQDAYTSRKPEAEELAERLLYEIHVGTCYASPTGVVLAAIWQTLLTGHLRRHLEPARVEPFDRKNLGDRMAEAVERLGAWNHPLGF